MLVIMRSERFESKPRVQSLRHCDTRRSIVRSGVRNRKDGRFWVGEYEIDRLEKPPGNHAEGNMCAVIIGVADVIMSGPPMLEWSFQPPTSVHSTDDMPCLTMVVPHQAVRRGFF